MNQSSIPMFLWFCILYCGLTEAAPADELSKASNAFAVNLYKEIGEARSGNDLFYSPISISTAFGMVSLGAKGNTREQTKAVLHLDKIISDESVKKAYRQLFKKFKRQANSYTLHLVNSLFGSNAFDYHRKFLQDVKNSFRSSMERLDFKGKPEESLRHINDWVKKEQTELISYILPNGSINNDTILFIVNAIYFKARWMHPFPKALTKPGPFSISKCKRIEIEMMHLYSTFLNYHNSSELNCQVVELPYQGKKASMFVFLPHEVEGLKNVEKQLTGEKLVDTLSKVQRHNMEVQLPRFTIDKKMSLKAFLQVMGMVDVFNATVSDLSGIGGGPDRLVVSDAIHKALVYVSESGTDHEAAFAATAISVTRSASAATSPIRFIVDRPFLFLIYEKSTKSVLFKGRLVRPPLCIILKRRLLKKHMKLHSLALQRG